MYKHLGSGLLAFLAFTATATAQAQDEPGFYLGASLAKTDLELGDDDELSIEADDIGYRLFAGYYFGPYFAVEAEWFDGGELIENVLDVGFEFGIDGFIGSALARLPLNDIFGVFARVGYASYDVELDVEDFGSGSDSETDLAYGLGVTAVYGQRWEGRFEYATIDLRQGEFSMISMSALYRF
jgi:OmpA-OmpF porin, OOP family